MKRRPMTRASAFLLISALAANPALAFLGVGDIVYDPTNYLQALQRRFIKQCALLDIFLLIRF